MALFELGLVLLFLLIVAVVVIVAMFLWGLKHALILGLNSIIGFFALYAVKAWVWNSLVINFWSIALVAVFGIFGFLFVLVMHWLGYWW